MKYKVGAKLLYNFYGDVLIPCEVVKVYAQSNRYLIAHNGNNVGGAYQDTVKETELFESQLEFLDSKIFKIQNEISVLQEQLLTVEQKRNILN
jgi:hypothetical protein